MANVIIDGSEVTSSPIMEYARYSEIVGVAYIPEALWPRLSLRAQRIVRQVTHGRVDLDQTTEDRALLDEALCVAADALHAADTFVAAEKVGGYQVNFLASTAPTKEDAYREARRVLQGSGLTFSGIGSTGL